MIGPIENEVSRPLPRFSELSIVGLIMEPIRAEAGWFILHAFYSIDRKEWGNLPRSEQLQCRTNLEEALCKFRLGENCQANCYAVLGHKADFGVMLVDPELHHLNETENQLIRAFAPGTLRPTYSFFSLSEVSEYMSQDKDYDRTLREKEGLSPDSDEYQKKMEAFRQRMQVYINERLYPQLPEHRVMCFYPMNKRRDAEYNWYSLDFDTRRQLMSGHLITGRKFAGKVKQLVTGGVGLDDWEWGVTLFADDPFYLKKIVYDMRYDEVSARYAEFGPFLIGIRLDPGPLFDRLRL